VSYPFYLSPCLLYTYAMSLQDSLRLNRTAFSTGRLHDTPDDRTYWLAQTPLSRLKAVEIMRQAIYGYNPSTTRLQRILTITRLQGD
jgi:hypothetical protein